jgi:hypothetical protein
MKQKRILRWRRRKGGGEREGGRELSTIRRWDVA